MTSGAQGTSAGPPSKLVGLGARRPRPPALGEGGQGYIYGLEDDPDLVIKVFRRPSEELSARLRALVRQGQRLIRPGAYQPVAWPVELIMNEDGEVGGYLMRRYGMPAHHRLEALFAPVTRQEAYPQADWRFLAGVARNLAVVVDRLHRDEAMFAIGDLSPANIMIDAKGYVTLLDSDSMQFTDPRTHEVFPSAAITPHYAPPELQTRDVDFPRSAYTDNFSLAVLVLQLLLCGEHPFSGQPVDGGEAQYADNIREARSHLIGDGLVQLPRVALSAEVLPPEIRAMAMSAFREGRLDARQRPTAGQWVAELDRMNDGVGKCPAGHAFRTSNGECPWCERLALGLPDPFGKPLPADYEPSARVRAARVFAAGAGAADAPPTVTVPGRGPTTAGPREPAATPQAQPQKARPPSVPAFAGALIGLIAVLVLIIILVIL